MPYFFLFWERVEVRMSKKFHTFWVFTSRPKCILMVGPPPLKKNKKKKKERINPILILDCILKERKEISVRTWPRAFFVGESISIIFGEVTNDAKKLTTAV